MLMNSKKFAQIIEANSKRKTNVPAYAVLKYCEENDIDKRSEFFNKQVTKREDKRRNRKTGTYLNDQVIEVLPI